MGDSHPGGTECRLPRGELTEWERQFESKAYVGWCETQPCIYCGGGPCCCSHTRKTRAAGGWAEDSAPACFSCHTLEHTKGRETAALLMGLTRAEIIRRVYASRRRWEAVREIWELRYQPLEE